MRRVGAQAQAMAVVLSIAVAALAWELSPEGLGMRVWQPFCEAANLRPPERLFPGLWRILVALGVRAFGLSAVAAGLKLLGSVALGGIAYLATNCMYAMLSPLLRTENCRADFRDVLIPGLVAAGVGLFVTTNPLFASAASFSPQLLTILIAFLVLDCLRRFLAESRIVCGFVGVFALGVLTAEGGLGFVLLVLAFVAGVMRIRLDRRGEFVMSDPTVYHVLKWLVTADFLLGFALMLVANVIFFDFRGGIVSAADLTGYFGSDGVISLAVSVAMVLAPLVITVGSLPQATDNYTFLSYFRGVMLVGSGAASLVFLLSTNSLAVRSEVLQAMLNFGAAFNLVAVFVAVTVEIYCRNHRAVFMRQQGLESDEVKFSSDENFRFPRLVRRSAYLLMVAILLGAASLLRVRDGTRRLATVVETATTDLVEEAQGLSVLFTDGSLDAGVEAKAALAGRPLLCHSMLDDRDPYQTRLRLRGLGPGSERRLMEVGASVALSDWAMTTNNVRLATCGLQLGFEIWQRVSHALPEPGWLLARPAGFAPEVRKKTADKAELFATQVLAGDYASAYSHTGGQRLPELFDTIVFRTAQLLAVRAQAADRAGDAVEATRLLGLSRKLNYANRSYDRLMGFLNLMWNRSNLQLTPREALRIALERANFKLAKPHAEAVLSTEPDNHFANFALGMYYYLEKNYARADIHLSAARRIRPKEATILNNLAIVRMYLGRLDEAKALVDAALEARPQASEIKATQKEICARLQAMHAGEGEPGRRPPDR